ncbi:ESF1 homolog [Anopheles arabiensis]|uniref:Uncharacterized protein n=1 Tax=Anopheles arabiensis TaxID=7173 RepID=A0A182HJF6_ANOAR|nr:ESF1 homolog [Anopheles arabiensis]
MKDAKKKSGPAGKGKGDKTAKKQANSSTQQSNGNGNAPKMWDDDRFAHLINNPRYHGMPKSKKTVKIDSRFKAMFDDERFNQKATMDKYGRKIKKTDSDLMRKFYHLDSDEENEEEAAREREREERAMEGRAGSESDEGAEGLQLTKEEKKAGLSGKVKDRLKDLEVDFARGEGLLESSSDDDDSDGDEEEGQDVFIEHVWGELDAEAERTEESTRRLAVCHMDWDRIRAVDVMVLLSSFLPPGSAIKSVTIYPSEYGKQRMKEEEERGPQELTVRTIENSDEEEEDEEVQKERLREYQLNRLKYYYAVVECDSVATADKIYKECDGIEYESTANKLDLRFIPDDMEFDDAPKDRCTELPEVGKYVPRIFGTAALHQSKVELTWDENDLDRKEFNEKLRDGKWADLPEAELKKYVVCSSSDEEGEDEDGMGSRKSKRPVVRVGPADSDSDSGDEENGDGTDSDGEPKGSRKEKMIAKYRALLNDIKEQEREQEEDKVGLEFSWKVNGKEEDEENNDQSDAESDDEPAKPPKNDVNPFEKILQKKKEKNKRRKELKKRRKRGELDGSGAEATEDDSSEDDLPHGVDLNDPFFASAFDEKEFGVGKKKQKSKQKEREAIKRAKEEEEREAEENERRRAELELMLDDGEDNRAHFNLRAIQEREIDLRTVSKSKRRALLKKSRREIEEQRNRKAAADDFEVNTEDPRFSAIYSKPDFSIDPTNPAFKKTKAMERLIETKLRKRQLAENDVREENGKVVQPVEKVAKRDVSTTMLVKSIKRKIGKA